jgi:hypothetical protein
MNTLLFYNSKNHEKKQLPGTTDSGVFIIWLNCAMKPCIRTSEMKSYTCGDNGGPYSGKSEDLTP